MRFARVAGGLAMGLVMMAPGFASAAWNNVFQLTCCGSPPRVANYAPAPSPCCPQQTAYVQRSFYQPVTAYKPVATLEPVTSYRTSYYYEPVQTMTYSMYVDPCTGCASQVATPCTSYQVRSKCDAVTNYVQRISYQPVTAYRQSFYMEPVTVNPCAPPVVASAPPAIVAPPPGYAPPALNLQGPTTTEGSTYSSPPPPLNDPLNRSNPPSTSEKGFNAQTSIPRPVPAPVFRPERIASNGAAVTGTVVRSDFQPKSGARIRFVSAQGEQLPATADATGRFNVKLASGSWRIYMDDATGRATYHSDITVRSENRNVMVVSR